MVLVHGADDETVPVSISEGFVRQARMQGDDAHLTTVKGGHFEHLDPSSDAWAAAVAATEAVR